MERFFSSTPLPAMVHRYQSYWAMPKEGPAEPEKPALAGDVVPLPEAFASRIDALERQSHTGVGSLPLDVSVYLEQRSFGLRVAKAEAWATVKGALSYAGRGVRMAVVTAGTHLLLRNTSLVASALTGALSDAGVRNCVRKQSALMGPPALPDSLFDEVSRASAMPGAYVSRPRPQLLAPAPAPPVLPPSTAVLPAPSASLPPPTPLTRTPVIDAFTFKTQQALCRIDAEVLSKGVDGRHNLARLPAGLLDTSTWFTPGLASETAQQAAGKVASAGAHARAQVIHLRKLQLAHLTKAAEARANARHWQQQGLEAEKLSEPTVFYQMLIGGALSGAALVFGAALGAVASVVFVFPGSYLLMRALLSRSKRDARAEAQARLCKNKKDLWLGSAKAHARWAERLEALGKEQLARWQQAVSLSAELATHVRTCTPKADPEKTEA